LLKDRLCFLNYFAKFLERINWIVVSDLNGKNYLKVHLNQSSKIRSYEKVTKNRNQGFSEYFCLVIEGSGSVTLINGSGWLKNLRGVHP
jgi:hypothetical protein